MKRMKRIGSAVLAAVLLLSMSQAAVFAEDLQQANSEQEAQIQAAVHTITGFPKAGQKLAEVSFVLGQDQSELTAAMPKTISVYLDGAQSETEIPVSWVCMGDYEGTDDFYYQFNPQWDESEYTLAAGLDGLAGLPYVEAQRTSAAAEAGTAVTRAANNNASVIYSFLTQNVGFNSAAACGILANIECESSFNPNLYGDNGTSYGICQWHAERLTSMQDWCSENGYDWKSLTGQLNYLKKELSANTSAYLYNGLKISNYMKSVENSASGSYDAGYYWCYYYEVPANKENVSVTRGNKAKNNYWPEYGSNSVTESSGQTSSGTQVYSVFSDVSKDSWYCAAVQYVYDRKIMCGTSSTKFEPNKTTDRATAVMVLYNLSKYDSGKFGLTASKSVSFSDVPSGKWYTDAVKWAAGTGIVSGYSNGKFGPNDSVTREQFAVMLYQYAQKLGWNVSASTSLSSYSDSGSISSWAKTAMQWAVAKKIMSGSNGALTPKATLTRAQAASMLQSFAELA